MIKQKFLTALLALLTISATGAWAQTEESESFTTNTQATSYSGEHFTINCDDVGDSDGFFMNKSNNATISALNGENITRVVLTAGFYQINAGETTSTVVTVDATENNPTINITGINATSLTLGNNSGIQIKTVVVYYTAGGSSSEPAADGEVTITGTSAEGQQAEFDMPQNDVTVTYTLKRDMTVDVHTTIADRIRIYYMQEMDGFAPVNADEILPEVTDELEGETPVTLQKDTHYTLQLQKQSETDPEQWTDATQYSVGTFRYAITGTGDYTGDILTAPFQLYQGYPVEIAAQSFATYYSEDEALTLEESFAETAGLYTISEVTATEAVLSEKIDVMPKRTPMLIYNESDQQQQILLIPTADVAPLTDVAAEFKGTAVEKDVTAEEVAAANFYVLTDQNQFVWVKDAGTIAANKCWLEIAPSQAVGARRIVFSGSGTTGVNEVIEVKEVKDDSFYDLNGRKVAVPNRKGIYIKNGQKVVVK